MADKKNKESEFSYKIFYLYLLDAIISNNEMDEIRDTQKKFLEQTENTVWDIEQLKVQIGDKLEIFSKRHDIIPFEEISKEVTSLLEISMDKYAKRIQEESKRKLSNLEVIFNSAKTNSIKNIQATLSTDFLRIVDYSISTRLIDGIYESKASYSSEGGIKYDFLLNSNAVDIFKETLKLYSLEKNVKIPYRFNPNAPNKESQIESEKIDRFHLEYASINKGSMFATFANPDDKSKAEFVMSRGNESPFLSVELSRGESKIDVSSNPMLHSNLEMDKIQPMLDRIYGSLKELEISKSKLVSLTMDGVDLIGPTEFRDFAKRLIGMRKEKIKQFIHNLKESSDPESNNFNLVGLREKLKLCNKTGSQIASLLDIKLR